MITLELNGIADLFEQITVCEDTKEHKPDPEPMLFSASQMKIDDMSSILYVGDAVVDYQCALASGADFALVDWTRMNREGFAALGIPRIIKSLDELL